MLFGPSFCTGIFSIFILNRPLLIHSRPDDVFNHSKSWLQDYHSHRCYKTDIIPKMEEISKILTNFKVIPTFVQSIHLPKSRTKKEEAFLSGKIQTIRKQQEYETNFQLRRCLIKSAKFDCEPLTTAYKIRFTQEKESKKFKSKSLKIQEIKTAFCEVINRLIIDEKNEFTRQRN